MKGYPTVTDAVGDSVTSRTQGFAGSGIGVIQDLRSVGLPGSIGMGLAGLSGLGDEYRGLVTGPPNPLSPLNNMSNEYMVLGINMAAGFELTDKLSVGAVSTLGTGFEQLGFIGPLVGSAMVHSYALRGTFGLDYNLDPANTVCAYYQTSMDFNFPNAVLFAGTYHDVHIDQPQTIGVGYANRSLMDGDLLLAADAYYKLWRTRPFGRTFSSTSGRLPSGQIDPRADQVPPGIFLQLQSDQPQCGSQSRRIPPAPVTTSTLPGGCRPRGQPAADHGGHRLAGIHHSEHGSRFVCRRIAQG